MSLPILYSAMAETDLDEIGEWISDAAGVDIAIAYVRRIRAKCEKLSAFPGLGTRRDEFGSDVRSVIHGRYLILYRTSGRATTILRVIHGSRSLRGVALERS